MAYQPKSYRKFVAGTITAAVVASAVAPIASAATFPDVSSTDVHAPAINELTEKGIIKGLPNGTFNPTGNVTRGQVAKIFARILPGEGKAEQVFTDVPVTADPELVAAAYEVKVAGVLTGANGYLFPANDLTRQQMAKVLVEAFDLKATDAAVNLKDLDQADSSFREYISILAQNGVTVVADGNYRPTEKVTRAQFATFVSRAMKLADTELKVDGVSATNATTLTVTGANLDDLTAADITVADNTVTSYTASEDGKTATVRLGSELVVDEVTKVTVKDASFDVTYKVDATTAAVVEATYDDDIADQFVAITVDGKKVTAQELINAGYNVEFEAFTSKAATTASEVTTDLFSSVSTGELRTDLATGALAPIPVSGKDLYVKVTLTKGSEVITSSLSKVTIKNLDLAADTITKATLLNYGQDGAVGGTGEDFDFEQNSSTLVTGETAVFSELKVKAGSEEEEVTTGFTVKSSDASVVSVDDTTGELTAQGPGTATITVTYGGAKYTKTITVKNGEREATKISVEKTSVTVTETGTTTIDVNLLDQYGDPMEITGGTNVVLEQSNTDKATAVLGNSTDETGDAELDITGVEAGSSLITFRDAAGVKIGTTSVKVTVTENDTLSQYSLTIDDDITAAEETALNGVDGEVTSKDVVSKDATLDLQDDKFLKLKLKGLNSAGVEVSAPGTAAADYTVTTNVSAPGVLATVYEQDGYLLVKAGTKAGTATITVTNDADSKIVKTFKVTVQEIGYNVTGASLKNVAAPTYATTLNYEDFLTHTKAENDPLVSGLTLSKSAAQPVRLDLSDDSLYIDKDADGNETAGDIPVGSVVITTTGTIADAASYTDVVDGIEVASGDDGTVLFKVLDTEGNVVATKAVSVDF